MHFPAPYVAVGPLPNVRPERRPFASLAALAAALVALTLAAPASALDINLSYDEDKTPSWDPTGERLMMIAHAAADIWESHILDNRSLHFDISWDNLDSENRLGKYVPAYVEPWDSIDLVFSTERNNAPVNWFIDATPLMNEEFGTLNVQLARDLTPQHRDESFAGPVPGLMEVGVSTVARFGTAADGNIDLLSVMMHEMGHALGINFSLTDDDYDFHPSTIGGLEVGAMEDEGYHLVLDTSLMNHGTATPGFRTFPSATDILATHDQKGFKKFRLQRIDLLGAHSDAWSDTLNWIGGQLPTGASDVFARSGASVRLESGSAEMRSLLVDEGSTVLTAFSSNMRVINELRVGNAYNGTQGTVHVGNLVGAPRLEAGTLRVDNGTLNLASQEASMLVHHQAQISSGSTLMGAGTVEARGELNNDGEISAGTFMLFGFGGDLTLQAAGAQGKLDLDGGWERVNSPHGLGTPIPGLGMEFGRISAVNGNLHVASPLADDFNGVATVGADRTMSFAHPWAMGGELNLRGGNDGMSVAVLTGAEMIWGGSTIVEGVAMITAPVITGTFAGVHIRSGGFLSVTTPRMGVVGGPTEYRGRLSLEPNAKLHVDVAGTNAWTLTKSLELGAGAVVLGDEITSRGRISGNGKLAVGRVDNLGTMAPGNYIDATGALDVTSGLFNQGAAARLEMDIAGFTQGSFDVLRTGIAQIGGTLAVTLADGFLPAVGSQFDLVTSTNLAGAFSNLTLSVPSGVTFNGVVDYQSTKATFRVTQAALGADLDIDGDVDSADLAVWKSTGGTETNGGFFLLWQRQLGRHVNTAGSFGGGFDGGFGGEVIGGVVPEPSTGLLALAALAVLPWRRKR
jgi:hypothetical protein